MRRAWLFCTVFITGAAIMVIELLGTRLIAPFYGSSLYVWTSIIAVTMMALALGYFLGGLLADRSGRARLSHIVAAAGLLTLVIPALAAPVLMATDSFGLRLGSFTSTLLLFFPSLTALGMVSPFAIKLATSSIAGVGLSAGSIYAVSTTGSVVGTLLLGFFLFPVVGSREIFIAVGIVLLALAIGIYFMERQHGENAQSPLAVAVLALAGLIYALTVGTSEYQSQDESFLTRFEEESLYGWVRVIDNPAGNFRVLTMDSSIIGASSLNTGASALAYQRVVDLIPMLRPGMRSALLIGQGAGHMSGQLARAGIVTDTMEIDPAIVKAADEFFGFQATGKTIVGDARYETRQLEGEYDLVILDVFTGGAEPFHLLTVEYMQQLKDILRPQGLLALNFVGFYSDGADPALASVAATLGEVFEYQRTFISEPGIDFNDFVFIAANSPIDTTVNTLSPAGQNWFVQREISIDRQNGRVLTDNYNPLEKLQVRKSENYRQVVTGLIGVEQLLL